MLSIEVYLVTAKKLHVNRPVFIDRYCAANLSQQPVSRLPFYFVSLLLCLLVRRAALSQKQTFPLHAAAAVADSNQVQQPLEAVFADPPLTLVP